MGQLEGKEISTLKNSNNTITLHKIQKTVTCLKNEEAPVLDSITNEMLKCSNVILLSKLEELFNNNFDLSYYADAWNNGLIYSIYKSQVRFNPVPM